MIKRYILIIVIILLLILSGCIQKDPLYEIKRLARSKDLDNKIEASKQYKYAIDTLVDAYKSYGSLNKDIGNRLMMDTFNRDYKDAIKHFEIAKDILSEDSEVYFLLGVCYVSLFKIENKFDYLYKAEENYQVSLRLNPGHMDTLFSYANMLIFGIEKYDAFEETKINTAIQLLDEYIYGLSPKLRELKKLKEEKGEEFVNPKIKNPDPEAFFLLGRAYYLAGDYKSAYQTFNQLYEFKSKLSKEQKNKLDEFIQDTARLINETN